MKKKNLHWLFISICTAIVALFAVLGVANSSYLSWDYCDPELAVVGTVCHAFEWWFVRLAPIVFIGAMVGAVMTRKKG